MTAEEKTRNIEGNTKDSLRHRLLIRFAIDGDLRFISHHDTVRMFERMLARAALPVKFSEGFNPKARLSLPAPRPVGIASDDEWLVVECDQEVAPQQALDSLAPQAPRGLTLREARAAQPGEKLQPRQAAYRMPLPAEAASGVRWRIDELLACERFEVERRDPDTGAARRVDIRPWLIDVRVDGESVEWTQAVTGQGTARPGEVLTALGLDPGGLLHRVRRASIAF